jgi:hypothetical protein
MKQTGLKAGVLNNFPDKIGPIEYEKVEPLVEDPPPVDIIDC